MPVTGPTCERLNEVAVVDCCVSASDDYTADVVNTVVDCDDVGKSVGVSVDDVCANQLLLSGDNEVESRMSASVLRVVHRVCTDEVSSVDVVAVPDCVCAGEAECECVTHTVVHEVDHVIC